MYQKRLFERETNVLTALHFLFFSFLVADETSALTFYGSYLSLTFILINVRGKTLVDLFSDINYFLSIKRMTFSEGTLASMANMALPGEEVCVVLIGTLTRGATENSG